MSLSKIRKVTEEGVRFQSHIDGSRHMLTPERAVEIQCLLGSDIQMQLDECIELPAERDRAERGDGAVAALGGARAHRVRAPGEARSGAVRDRAGRHGRRAAAALGGSARRHGFSRLRGRRPRGRRGPGADAGDARRCGADPAGGEAALSHGRRHAGGPHRGGRARHRHVRLRAADAQRPPRPRLHVGRARQPAQRPARRRSGAARPGKRLPGRARLFARLPASPRAVGRVSRARCCCRGRTRPSISSSWRRCARRSRRTASRPGPRRRSGGSPRPTPRTPRSGRRARLRCACAARGATGTRPTR